MNRRSINISLAEFLQEKEENEEPSVIELLRSKGLRYRSFILWYTWFIICCVFYGLSFYAVKLAGNLYVNFILLGIAEIPGFVAAVLVSKYVGRRTALCTSLILGGLASLATPLTPPGHVMSTVLVLVGKCGASMGFAVVYLFTSELYPTYLRNLGVGAGNVFARAGGVAAPFVGMLTFWGHHTPVLMFGSGSLIAGLLCIILPETHNRPLPDSIEQAEQQANNSIANLCRRCKGLTSTNNQSHGHQEDEQSKTVHTQL